jgi:gliding motility-associated-like protein
MHQFFMNCILVQTLRKPLLLLPLLLMALLYSQSAAANHVKGGYIEYKYNGAGSTSGTSNYTITVTVFFSCTTNGPKQSVYLGIFNASTNALVASKSISYSTVNTITKTSYSPCMSNPPTICYELRTFVYSVDLPDISAGYILAVQDALRVSGIINISNSGSSGITITAMIPGTINSVDYHKNNSPNFIFLDTAIVCYNGNFSYPFKATDADGDSLSYGFGSGLNVSSASGQTSSNVPGSPPYPILTYNPGYSGTSPLGSSVTIDPATGLLSGTAPGTTGEYVVAVYVKEWRNGVLIDSIKKELQIYVYNCSLSAASLNSSYTNCDNYSFTFQNESAASNITSYNWDFGVPVITTDVSTAATPTYSYPAAGTYTIKLKVGNSSGCVDSATSTVKVYPGFTPNFTATGSCYQSPFQFTDATYAQYGTVNSWSWSFGDNNTSTTQNPSNTYSSPGNYTVTLAVGSSVGCAGTVSKTITASDKPDLVLPFTDTLICTIDTLPLIAHVTGSGITYSWSPNYNIQNANSANPLVWPKETTVYTITVTQNACVATGSITVNTLDFITVDLPADTTVCKTDSFTLNPVSHALQYIWTPATGLSSTTVKNPVAYADNDITYSVTANLGKCQDQTSMRIKVVPYPQVYAGTDTTICYGSQAPLNASMVAAYFTWTPVSSLTSSNILTPVAHPTASTSYTITVTDTLGCPKPVSDTVTVFVTPKIVVFAGNDTAVVTGQPLQLHAIANDSITFNYNWNPASWLSDATIYNPVATFPSSVDSITYTITASTAAGCYGTDALTIKVYKTNADIFMPNAFSPNSDGKNDVFKPVLVGISKMTIFSIYNRWGQLVYTTSQHGKGWDGTIHGTKQDPGTYVYLVSGIDYLGRVVTKKGAFTLVR